MINSVVDRKKIALHIKKISKKELRKDLYKNRSIDCCPNCGSNHYIKFGFFNKIQRYKCKDCDKTFSKATNSLCYYSKKGVKVWIEFVRLLNEKKSLRYCAKELKISVVTAFYWRHKILHALTMAPTPETLKGVVHIGKTVIKENFKGNRNLRFLMSEINGEKFARKNIWVFAAKDTEDSMFVNPTLSDSWDNKIFNEAFYSKIDRKAYIVPYVDNYLKALAKRHNGKRVHESNEEDRIKFIRRNMRKWFSDYHGVASKYLKRYLSLFVLFNLDKLYDYIDLVYDNLICGNKFIKTEYIKMMETNI